MEAGDKSEEKILHVTPIFYDEEEMFRTWQWIGCHNLLNER